MKVGDIFEEKLKVLRGYDRMTNDVVVEEINLEYKIAEIYDKSKFLGRNTKTGERKMFFVEE